MGFCHCLKHDDADGEIQGRRAEKEKATRKGTRGSRRENSERQAHRDLQVICTLADSFLLSASYRQLMDEIECVRALSESSTELFLLYHSHS